MRKMRTVLVLYLRKQKQILLMCEQLAANLKLQVVHVCGHAAWGREKDDITTSALDQTIILHAIFQYFSP